MSTTGPTFPLGTGLKVLTLTVQHSANYPTNYFSPITGSGGSNITLKNIRTFFNDLLTGSFNSNVTVVQGGVFATIGATFASVVATNTLVIGGVTITAVNSAPTSVQFLVGSTDTATAANAVSTINALSTLNKVVFATSSGAVVTITCLYPGTIGNLITTTAAGGTITVASTLAGGTDSSTIPGYVSHGL